MAAVIAAAQAPRAYRVTHMYMLGGEGSWDYIVPDPPHNRLFIARQNRVMVVDEDSGTLIGEVPGFKAPTGPRSPAAAGMDSPPQATISPW
jgi:hypothetical protein